MLRAVRQQRHLSIRSPFWEAMTQEMIIVKHFGQSLIEKLTPNPASTLARAAADITTTKKDLQGRLQKPLHLLKVPVGLTS